MSGMCTGRYECSLKTKAQFTCQTLYMMCSRETTPDCPEVTHSLAHLSAFACLKVNRRAFQDMATWQTRQGLKKKEAKKVRNLLKREWQIGKMSTAPKKTGKWKAGCQPFSNELTCHGNTVHANMCDAETCACHGRWRAGVKPFEKPSGEWSNGSRPPDMFTYDRMWCFMNRRT